MEQKCEMVECLKFENLSHIFEDVHSLQIDNVNITYSMDDIDGILRINCDDGKIVGTQIRKSRLTPYSIISVVDVHRKSWRNYNVSDIVYASDLEEVKS